MVAFSSGSGAPGSIPEFFLLSDQSAAADVVRSRMGIVKNLDLIIFTDVDKKALWKYDTSSSKPTLHPLEHLRVDTSPSRIDDTWKEVFQQLLNNLPPDVKAAFEQNLAYPLEERNPSLVALGRLLEGLAKVMTWLQNSSAALDPNNPIAGAGSEIEARKNINMALPQLMMSGIIQDSYATFQSLRDELFTLGRNDSHYDELTGVLSQMGMAYNTIIELHGSTESTA